MLEFVSLPWSEVCFASYLLPCIILYFTSCLSQDYTGNAGDLAIGWAIAVGAPFVFRKWGCWAGVCVGLLGGRWAGVCVGLLGGRWAGVCGGLLGGRWVVGG